MTVDQIYVAIRADISDFQAKLDQATQGIRQMGDRMQEIGGALTKALTLPLSLIGGAAIKAATDMDSLERGLTAVMGGADAARSELAKLKDVAKLPGLGFKEAIQGSINLQAAGFSADQSRKSLQAFGNALATVGKGKAELDGVVLALGQIQSKGKVSAEEINQIAERVPQIRKVMQDAFGTADTEILGKMGIQTEEFVTKVTDELSKLPPVTGGMKNAFENAGDTIFISLTRIGTAINKNFDIEGKLAKVSEVVDNLTKRFEALSPQTQQVILTIAGVAAAIGPVLLALAGFVKAIAFIQEAISVASAAITAFSAPVALIVAAVAAAAYLIVTNWDSIKAYFEGDGKAMLDNFAALWTTLKETVSAAMETVSLIVGAILNRLRAFWAEWGDEIMIVAKTAMSFIQNNIIYALTIIKDTFKFISAVIKGDWSGVWDAIVQITTDQVGFVVKQVKNMADGIVSLIRSMFTDVKRQFPEPMSSHDKKPFPEPMSSHDPANAPNTPNTSVRTPSTPKPNTPRRTTPARTKADDIRDVANSFNDALATIERKRNALDFDLFPRSQELQNKISAAQSALDGFFRNGLTGKDNRVKEAITLLENFQFQLSEIGNVARIKGTELGDRVKVSVADALEGVNIADPIIEQFDAVSLRANIIFAEMGQQLRDSLSGAGSDFADVFAGAISQFIVFRKEITATSESWKNFLDDFRNSLRSAVADAVKELVKVALIGLAKTAVNALTGGSGGSILGGLLSTTNITKSAASALQARQTVIQPVAAISMNELTFAIKEFDRSV